MANYIKGVCLTRPFLSEKYKTSQFPNLHKKYRSHFEILALVLEAINDNGASPSFIMRYAGMNYKQLKKYLESLTKIGFVDASAIDGQISYRVNEKGLAFLRQYYVLLGMLLGIYTENDQLTLFTNLNKNLIDKSAHQYSLQHALQHIQ
jgi:predicted transcriptional regulator